MTQKKAGNGASLTDSGGFLTRDAIINADDLKSETVECPEWGGNVLVRELTHKEKNEFLSRVSGDREIEELRAGKVEISGLLGIQAWSAWCCVIGTDGKRVFSAPKDLDDLTEKSSAPLDRIFGVVQKLSGLTQEAVDEMGKESETEDTPLSSASVSS